MKPPLKQQHSASKRDQRKPAGVHLALDPGVGLHDDAVHALAAAAGLRGRRGLHRAGEAHERVVVVGRGRRGGGGIRGHGHRLGGVRVDRRVVGRRARGHLEDGGLIRLRFGGRG